MYFLCSGGGQVGDNEKEIAVLENRIENLGKDMASMKSDREKKDADEERRYLRLENKLDETLKIVRGRPTWVVLALITSLSGLCTSMITFIVTTM